MARFQARFAAPVVYQDGHPKARRMITDLVVSAPDLRQAEIHVIRVVSGDLTGMTIAPYIPSPPTPPSIESIPTIAQEYL